MFVSDYCVIVLDWNLQPRLLYFLDAFTCPGQ